MRVWSNIDSILPKRRVLQLWTVKPPTWYINRIILRRSVAFGTMGKEINVNISFKHRKFFTTIKKLDLSDKIIIHSNAVINNPDQIITNATYAALVSIISDKNQTIHVLLFTLTSWRLSKKTRLGLVITYF